MRILYGACATFVEPSTATATEDLAEAWKVPLKQESNLAILIREPSVPIQRVADVLRAECAKRARGKPGGAHWRWTKPHYLIAYFIEQSGAERTDG